MKKIPVFILLMSVALIMANPNYFPRTTMAELCLVQDNSDCNAALMQLSEVLDNTNRGEFIAAHLFQDDGVLGSVSVAERINNLGVDILPTIFFNRETSLSGPPESGSYSNIVDNYKFSASPLKMDITSFNPETGAISVTVKMLDPELSLINQKLILLLAQNSMETYNNVARQYLYHNLNLVGVGTEVTFNDNFTLSPDSNPDNLWAAALVEVDNQIILQSTSTLPLPEYYLRCAYDWDGNNIVCDPNTNFLSEPLWIFNLGAADTFNMRIVVDNAPADWYFNYCDEDGNCYPGSISMPLNLSSGQVKGFHLNLMVGSTGTAHFHFEIISPHIGTYNIPFICQTSDPVQDDIIQVPAVMTLKANSPNPFKNMTSFLVTANKASYATIQIFNLKGELVAETTSYPIYPGENKIEWIAPSYLVNGIYFYRLKEQPVPLSKMLLLK